MTLSQTAPDEVTAATIAAIERFNVAFNNHDVHGVMAAMTDDCVFESTGPQPDGARFEGQAAVREVWEGFFGSSPSAHGPRGHPPYRAGVRRRAGRRRRGGPEAIPGRGSRGMRRAGEAGRG